MLLLLFFQPHADGPTIVSTSEKYGADNVTVLVEWTQEDVSYNITIVPIVPIIVIGSNSVQLIIAYNVEYNLSLEAVVGCQNVAPGRIQLLYGELS